VRGSYVRELGEQISMGFQTVSLHFSIRDRRKEVGLDIVGKRPAVGWVRCFAPRLIRQHVRQQGGGDPRCFLGREPTNVLQ
jgi:hypothetical protein